MSEKLYKVTTENRAFKTNSLGKDLLKEEQGCFYIRENKTDTWERLVKLEKSKTILEWFTDGLGVVFTILFSYAILCGIPLLFGLLIKFIQNFFQYEVTDEIISVVVISSLFVSFGSIGYILAFMKKALKKLPPYFVKIPDKEIMDIIEYNNRTGYSNYYGDKSVTSRSYYGGYSSNSKRSFSKTKLNAAVKKLEKHGISWDILVNHMTDEERENLFTKYFGNAEEGKLANLKFNETVAYPARKSTLQEMIQETKYDDNSEKEKFIKKLDICGGMLSDEQFQSFAKEIQTFQEKKRRRDSHIKYEGRLNNKDIKAIKEYLGYTCMACGLDPIKEYGEDKKGIMEAHHKNPYSEMNEGEIREVKPDDFLILCPNCHKLIHKLDSPNDLEELKKLVNKTNKTSKSWWWD